MSPTNTSRTTLRGLIGIPLLALTIFFTAAAGGPSVLPGPATAQAAGCKGADKAPRNISSKSASKAVVCVVNKIRARRGLKRLNQSGNLNSAARRHSAKMQKSNCFDHECPGEPALTGRYEKAGYLPCNCSWGAGENIAWGRGGKGSPRRIVKAWMNSSSHRSQILNRSFKHVGVGVRWGSPYKRKLHAGTYTLDFGYKR